MSIRCAAVLALIFAATFAAKASNYTDEISYGYVASEKWPDLSQIRNEVIHDGLDEPTREVVLGDFSSTGNKFHYADQTVQQAMTPLVCELYEATLAT